MRLILDGAASGAHNMAADEALLIAGESRDAVSTLRFYSWSPACLSLGRFQRFDDALKDSALLGQNARAGSDWVRRPTGGRAVWHQNEITYSFVVRAETLPAEAQSVAGAYRFLSAAFIDGLRTLGVRAELAPAESRGEREAAARSANCFAASTRADFVVYNRKLIGAAQARRNGVILQHGSLLLDIEETAWQHAVGSSANMISLRELGVRDSREVVVEALCSGVERVLGVSLVQDAWNESETTLAKGLQRKYESPAWSCDARENVEPVRCPRSAL